MSAVAPPYIPPSSSDGSKGKLFSIVGLVFALVAVVAAIAGIILAVRGGGGEGPKGPAGPTGPKGDPGLTSNTGATGPTGPANGPKGDRGAAGPTGPTGSSGNNGTGGATGAPGATGATGAAGQANSDYFFGYITQNSSDIGVNGNVQGSAGTKVVFPNQITAPAALSTISYNATSGAITLTPGKTYSISAIVNFSSGGKQSYVNLSLVSTVGTTQVIQGQVARSWANNGQNQISLDVVYVPTSSNNTISVNFGVLDGAVQIWNGTTVFVTRLSA